MSDQSSLARAHPDHPTLSQLNTSPQSESSTSVDATWYTMGTLGRMRPGGLAELSLSWPSNLEAQLSHSSYLVWGLIWDFRCWHRPDSSHYTIQVHHPVHKADVTQPSHHQP